MPSIKWRRSPPSEDGQYFIATSMGESAGIGTVARDKQGKLLMAGLFPGRMWIGWWWPVPIVPPPPPPAGEL